MNILRTILPIFTMLTQCVCGSLLGHVSRSKQPLSLLLGTLRRTINAVTIHFFGQKHPTISRLVIGILTNDFSED